MTGDHAGVATAADLEDEDDDQAEGAAAAAAGASQEPAKRGQKKKKEKKKKKPLGSGSAGAFGGTAQQKETARVPLGPPPAKAARAAPEPKAVKDPNRPGLGRKHCTVAEAYDEWDAS